MSFGFGIGDIILIAQLAYRLYDTLATDNRLAVKELGNALFGLRCALDHLSRQANEISAQTSSHGDHNAERMRGDLDTMIASCAETLTELDKLFAKHASMDEGNQTSGSRVRKKAKLEPGNSESQLSLSGLKKTVKIGAIRIRWSKDSQLFTEYRRKLQSHTDTINIVLTTFLWSASQRLENASKVNAEKVQQIRDQTLGSNAELFRLVNGIHAAVSKSTQDAVPPAPMILTNLSPSPAPGAGHREFVIPAHITGGTLVNLAYRPASRPSDSSPSNSSLTLRSDGAADPHLSADLDEINKARSAVGREQFMLFGRHNRIPGAVSSPVPETNPDSFFGVEHPTVPQVEAELEKIIINMSTTRNDTSISNEIMTQRLHRWLQGFEAIVQSWLTSSATTKEDKQRRQKDGQALMLNLNLKISQTNDTVKKQIYGALDKDGIERTFENLRDRLRSVVVEKEIQIYEDERESFL